MCGFAGVIAWDEKYRVSHETLAKMSAAIAHRGPDGEGFHLTNPEKISAERPQIALAFRRLAILDPDPRSMQPFTDGRHWLVFNGEIYNFRELKKELSILRQDYVWRTTGDTEVLLCAYAVWGEKCVEKLNGMFAFAVWDEVEKSLFLARDRMGQKPLYVRQDDNAICFASELNAIPKDTPPGAFSIWLGDYLRYGCSAGFTPWSWRRIVREHPGGAALYRNAKRGNGPCGYFDPGRIARNRVDDSTAKSQTRRLLEQAVERQLVSDVPLGVFLSGGIDSSIVAAIARKFGPVKTFSIRFDDPRYDESEYARKVAEYLGTEHHEFTVRPDAATDLPKLAAMFGEPFGDSSALPTHYLSRETRAHVKVALSGDGGDELFGGYDRYRAMLWAERLSFLNRIGRWNEKKRSRAAFVFTYHLSRFFFSISRGIPKHPLTRVGRFFQSAGCPSSVRYDNFLRIFDDRTMTELCPDTLFMFPINRESYDIQMHGGADPVEAALACDRMRYLPDDLLTKVDRCSMLHGLEVRSPFMDHELVQFAAGLTTDQLLKGGPKRMLREAFADDLPAWVFKRKKMGFAVPIGDWFRGELRSMLRDTLFSSHAFGRMHFDMKVVERLVEEHETKRADHSQRLYALLMLELWWNVQSKS
jgi:asparagine synthase (glutamine-hydrolysing)